MLGRAAPVMAVALLFGGASRADEKKEPIWTASIGPNLPSFLTLSSGHSYTLRQMGPVIGREGKPLAWRVPFLSTTSNPRELQAAAEELLEMAKPDAEAAGLPAVVVTAVLSFDATTGQSSDYGIVFEKKTTGWEQFAPIENVPRASPEIVKLLDGWGGLRRDRVREVSGAKAAAEWVRLLDAGQFDMAWEQASPLLRALVSRDKWESMALRFVEQGKVLSRVEAARLYTGYAMNLPPATYLLVRFKTGRAGSDAPSLERVGLRLEEDGVWRAIGFWSG